MNKKTQKVQGPLANRTSRRIKKIGNVLGKITQNFSFGRKGRTGPSSRVKRPRGAPRPLPPRPGCPSHTQDPDGRSALSSERRVARLPKFRFQFHTRLSEEHVRGTLVDRVRRHVDTTHHMAVGNREDRHHTAVGSHKEPNTFVLR